MQATPAWAQDGNEWSFGVTPQLWLSRQGPIEEDCEDEAEMEDVIRETVVHEIGHYFGLDDETMHPEDGEE